jgi:phage regulator Rha-like protein
MTEKKPLNKDLILIPDERIESKILLIRGKKVMLDRDLAELYEVETALLKRQVKRNIDRFPDDFMFVLSKEEFHNWRYQFGTSKSIKMGLRYSPMAFTEQGVAMLSSVLNSKRAIQANIQIIRAFTKLREMMATHADLKKKIEAMERKYDKRFKVVFDVMKQLLAEPKKPKREIGFKRERG